ncbi:MAG: hypothetical protein KDN19_13230 [Verrucomicrobiae bacterium]|nr:hypothetical protein [Verrucomicrobiae bacterium]
MPAVAIHFKSDALEPSNADNDSVTFEAWRKQLLAKARQQITPDVIEDSEALNDSLECETVAEID